MVPKDFAQNAPNSLLAFPNIDNYKEYQIQKDHRRILHILDSFALQTKSILALFFQLKRYHMRMKKYSSGGALKLQNFSHLYTLISLH